MSSTICALATPPGAGGIAVVRVSGPEAYAVVGEIFTPRNPAKRVAEAKGYTAMLGHYHLRGEEMDETIALFFRAPHSYTGEDVIELSVHAMKAAANESFGYNEDEIVSSDIVGMRFGSLFDATQTMVNQVSDDQYEVQVVSWYDNENSYTSQMVRTIKYFSELA